jgi:DNA-binding CsgD family transcriptional regulator/pimeloyl-ACP methyl ester carboxylesterase
MRPDNEHDQSAIKNGSEHQSHDDLDLEIVSGTFRSIVDQNAFDKLILSWNQKLNAMEAAESQRGGFFSKGLLKQLGIAESTIERLDIDVQNDPIERSVSEVAGPAIVLTPDLRVSASNREGMEAFGVKTGAFLSVDVIDPASRSAFQSILRSANQNGNIAQTMVHVLDQKTPGARFHAEAFLLRVPGQDKAYVALRTLQLAWSEGTSQRLIQAFGLTQAEVDVARQFFELCDVKKVAELRGASVHTVRTQIKIIQAKTGATSQADLVRLCAMVASRQLLDTRGLPSIWTDPLGREEIITTPSGRKIAWTWIGAPNGRPIVFLRGMAMGYLLPKEAEDRLAKAGLKLLVPSRPGYGNSPLDETVPAFEDNCAALTEYLDHMGLRGCIGIGLSDGIIPLLAEQDRDPERFCGLIGIGFNGCLNRAAFRKLPVPQATLLRLAQTAPRLLELIAKLGYRIMQQHGVDWYLERAHASTPRDLETCKNPETATLVRDACAHMAVKGTRTFVRDMQMFHAPVDAAIDRLRIPMLCMVPTEDGLFDRDEYAELERRNARVRVLPVEGTADLLIYQETDFILDRIIHFSQQF